MDPFKQTTVRRSLPIDRAVATTVGRRAGEGIQPKFTPLSVRPVTDKALVRKNRQHFPSEIDILSRRNKPARQKRYEQTQSKYNHKVDLNHPPD